MIFNWGSSFIQLGIDFEICTARTANCNETYLGNKIANVCTVKCTKMSKRNFWSRFCSHCAFGYFRHSAPKKVAHSPKMVALTKR